MKKKNMEKKDEEREEQKEPRNSMLEKADD